MKTDQEIEAEFERIDAIQFPAMLREIDLAGVRFAHDNLILDVIEAMRQKGFCVALANGLDGTWEATFHDPKRSDDPDYELIAYARGDTLGIAVLRSALKQLFVL